MRSDLVTTHTDAVHRPYSDFPLTRAHVYTRTRVHFCVIVALCNHYHRQGMELLHHRGAPRAARGALPARRPCPSYLSFVLHLCSSVT